MLLCTAQQQKHNSTGSRTVVWFTLISPLDFYFDIQALKRVRSFTTLHQKYFVKFNPVWAVKCVFAVSDLTNSISQPIFRVYWWHRAVNCSGRMFVYTSQHRNSFYTHESEQKPYSIQTHTHTQGGSNRAALRFWNRRVELQHHMDLNLLTRVYLEMEFFFFSLMSSLNLSIITTGSNISDYITQPWDCLLSILSIHQTVTPTLCSKVLTHKNKYAELVFPEKVTLI